MLHSRYVLVALLLGLIVLSGCRRGETEQTPTPPTPPSPPDLPAMTMTLPRGELRAVWMTTAWELDWPRANYDPEVQRQLYTDRLDLLQELHFNTLFFQVRPMGDAFYKSAYEPWSEYITGVRGQDPGYDVLGFMIEEAHKRGIEFHAWMNPYRIDTRANGSQSYAPLHPSIPREWVWNLDKIQMYNPGLPDVRKRLIDITDELLTKYPDIDGVHLDDYFYPESSQGSFDDHADFKRLGGGHKTITDFRLSNVNQMVQAISTMIRQKHPSVTFSISPGSNAKHNLEDLYADVPHWCRSGWLDLVIPQLYQSIDPSKESGFYQRMMWFCQFSYKTPVAIGHAAYRIGEKAFSPDAAEILKQIQMGRKDQRIYGGVYYRLQDLVDNKGGIQGSLRQAYPTVMPLPSLSRDQREVAPIRDIALEGERLHWTSVKGTRSIVYHTPSLDETAKVLYITDGNEVTVRDRGYYTVTAIDDLNRQSKAVKVVAIK